MEDILCGLKEFTRLCILLALFTFFFACQEKTPEGEIDTEEIKLHCSLCAEPNLFVSESGRVFLSWIERRNDSTDGLVYVSFNETGWSAPTSAAMGMDWFVNWADFPSLVSYGDTDEQLAVHWLQKSEAGTYDYDVHISQSRNGGRTWSPSFIPHTDGVAAEHGFVSMLPLKNGRILAVWLDGRNTKDHDAEEHEHGHGGAMSLRCAEFDIDGNLFEENELDSMICDCCQTDAALTDDGAVVVYRDRTQEEIRDISIVRRVNGSWSKPMTIGNDGWEIAACPVNGPAIAADGKRVAVAWFTMAGNKAEVKVAFSGNSGASFGQPVRIDGGNPIGRVDVALSTAIEAYVSWMENVEGKAEIRLVALSTDGVVGDHRVITKTSPSRKSGFPILERTTEGLLIAWTESDSITSVKSMLLMP